MLRLPLLVGSDLLESVQIHFIGRLWEILTKQHFLNHLMSSSNRRWKPINSICFQQGTVKAVTSTAWGDSRASHQLNFTLILSPEPLLPPEAQLMQPVGVLNFDQHRCRKPNHRPVSFLHQTVCVCSREQRRRFCEFVQNKLPAAIRSLVGNAL